MCITVIFFKFPIVNLLLYSRQYNKLSASISSLLRPHTCRLYYTWPKEDSTTSVNLAVSYIRCMYTKSQTSYSLLCKQFEANILHYLLCIPDANTSGTVLKPKIPNEQQHPVFSTASISNLQPQSSKSHSTSKIVPTHPHCTLQGYGSNSFKTRPCRL